MKKPILSIVIPTFNNVTQLAELLESLSKQKLSSDEYELIVSDGGSKDGTLDVAKKYGAKIIGNPDVLAEPGIYHGMRKASGSIIMVLAVDNIYENPNALQIMIDVFKDNDIFAAFPKHESKEYDNLFTKYVNTFTDPFNHFVYGLSANARTFHKVYKSVRHTDIYDIYDYRNSSTFPMIAIAQGFTVRREFVNMRKEKMDDLVSVMELIKHNKKIAYVHELSLYHHTIRDMSHFMRKQQWATKNALEKKEYGIVLRKNSLTKWQNLKIQFYPIYSFSIVLPILYSFIGVVRDRELLWLFHPIINFLCALAIAKQILIMKLGISNRISRQ